jgi:Uncharacterized protein conserved in bacteria
MKKLVLAVVFLTLSCDTQKTKQDNLAFDEVLEAYYQENLSLYKINATFQGDTRYNDSLPNFLSTAFQEKEKTFYSFYLNQIKTFEDNTLSEDALLSKKILIWECEMNLKAMEFPKDKMPIDQMWGFQLTMGQLASAEGAQPFETVKDYENWLVRIQGYLKWLASAQEKMEEGMAIGWVLPQSLIKKVLPQLKGMTTSDLSKHLFYSPARNFPTSFSEEDKARLTVAYKSMVLDQSFLPIRLA